MKTPAWSIFYFQFWLTLHYLMTMTDEQTLVMYSGHPMGLFPSRPENPRLIITNGMVIPNYSTKEDYDRMFGLGVTMYDIPNIFPYSFPYFFHILYDFIGIISTALYSVHSYLEDKFIKFLRCLRLHKFCC